MNSEFRDRVVSGDVKFVENALATSPELVHERDEYEFTALHEAVGEDCREMIELLIRSNADVNAQNDEGIAPLHLVCYGYMVDLLLRGGAKIDLRSNAGLTPLHVQVENGDERIDVVEALAEAGADVMAPTPSGDYPYKIAVDLGYDEVAEVLEKYGGR